MLKFLKNNIVIIVLFVIAIALFLDGFRCPNKDFFTAAAVMVAAIAIFESSKENRTSKQRENSRFYLEKYIDGSKMILSILNDDKPKRRMVWVSAADMSKKLSNIENHITESVDKDFLKIYQSDYMHKLICFFNEKSAIYFYGVDDATDLDDAAEKCRENHGNCVDGLLSQLKTHDVHEDSIAKVLLPINSTFKDDCGVPILDENGSILMSVLEWNHAVFPGLYEYLKHKQSCEIVFDESRGNILKRKNKRET